MVLFVGDMPYCCREGSGVCTAIIGGEKVKGKNKKRNDKVNKSKNEDRSENRRKLKSVVVKNGKKCKLLKQSLMQKIEGLVQKLRRSTPRH